MRFEVLTPADMDLVHQKSLHILAQAGVKIDSFKILKMMAAAGCEVSIEESGLKNFTISCTAQTTIYQLSKAATGHCAMS